MSQGPYVFGVSGGNDQACLPLRIEPADDADLLYVSLVIFAPVVTKQIGGSSHRALRERMWTGKNEPHGLPFCTHSEAFRLTTEIIVWLEAFAPQIAHDPGLNGEPLEFLALIRKMRARYPRAEPKR